VPESGGGGVVAAVPSAMVLGRTMVQAPDLTHALLELGVCTSSDLDEAQARQLIYGGDLELNLLELQVAAEQDLLNALARVTAGLVAPGGPVPVEREMSAKVRAVVPAAVAGYVEDLSLRISLPGPCSDEERMLLHAAAADRPVQLQLTTTLRILEAQALLDGLPLDPRALRQLAQTGQLLTRLQDAPPLGSLRADPQPAPLEAVPPTAGSTASASSLTELTRLLAEEVPRAVAQPYVPVRSAPTPAPENKGADETAPPPAGYQELARSVLPPPPQAERPRAGSERPAPSPASDPAYPQQDALHDLASARDRDTIVSTICRFCAQYFEYVAVFGVQANEARGLVASGPGKRTEKLADLRVPLDVPSALSRVRDTGQHRVARLRAGGLEGGLVRDLERPLGRAVLLLPITVQQRTLLMIWADDGVDDVDIEHALPTLSLVRPAGAALERVLIERKRVSRLSRPSLAPGVRAEPAVAPPAVAPAPEPFQTDPVAPASRDSRPTRLGMSIPPAGSRPPKASSAPPRDVGGTEGDHPGLHHHPTHRDLAPPEARVSTGPLPETPRKRKLSESFSEAVHAKSSSSEAPTAESDRPLRFPSELPKTMKGFPADLRLKTNLSPTPKVGAPLLSRRIVAVSEHGDEEESPKASAPSSGGTMLSRRLEVAESPPPRIEERPPARPSPAPLSYRALVGQLLAGEQDALPRLIEGGESAVGALIAAFPGPTQEPTTPQVPASECGPILHAIVAIGSKATPFLTVRTADEDAAVRRWAVFLLGELPGRDAARAIADRLLDETVDVRRAALASARRIQRDALTRRTLRARLEEMTRDVQLMTDERCAAVEAIADIREHESIPTLLQLLDDESGAVKRAARWALSVLTRHDFHEDVQKWREFWQRHRNEPRSEWLLLALRNTEGDMARAAADEVESLVGAPIGDTTLLTDEAIEDLRQKLKAPPDKSRPSN
jgi:hypothetical protein